MNFYRFKVCFKSRVFAEVLYVLSFALQVFMKKDLEHRNHLQNWKSNHINVKYNSWAYCFLAKWRLQICSLKKIDEIIAKMVPLTDIEMIASVKFYAM